MIKPIQTYYKGYHFRSRLEARWAVFFDALGLSWEYEPEGYDLGPAGYYLPDFWLPDLKYWIEIKPRHLRIDGWGSFETAEDPTIPAQCGALAAASQRPVYLLTGPPGSHEQKWAGEMAPYLVFFGPSDEEVVNADDYRQWCECPACGAIDLCYGGKTDRCYCGCGQWATSASERISAAYAAARAARFEHGEQPSTSAPVSQPPAVRPSPTTRHPLATHTIAALCAAPADQIGVIAGRLVSVRRLLPAEEQGTVVWASLVDSTGTARLKVPQKVYNATAPLWTPGQWVLLTGRLVTQAGAYAGVFLDKQQLEHTILEVLRMQELPA